jgi:hypothetical protein
MVSPIANAPAQNGIRINYANAAWIHHNHLFTANAPAGSRLYVLTEHANATKINDNFETPRLSIRHTLEDRAHNTRYFRPVHIQLERKRDQEVSGSSQTSIIFDSELSDEENAHPRDSGTVVAPIGGLYQLCGVAQIQSSAADPARLTFAVHRSSPSLPPAVVPLATFSRGAASLCTVVELSKDDQVEMRIVGLESRALVLGKKTSFSMQLLPGS